MRLKRGTRLAILCTLLVTLTTGCPGSNSGAQATSSSDSSTASSRLSFGGSTTPGVLPPVGTQNFITINKAVRSNLDPNSLLELVGLGGEIGAQCPSLTDCTCVFNFTESSGILRETEQQPAYTETDLMRCLFTGVTADVKFFDVKIKILAGNLFSNPLRVFMPSANPSLDTSIAANYLPVQRYMCRDILGKAVDTNFYNKTILDPRLWEMSLAFNFYTTSFGRDYGATPNATAGGTATPVPGFECPLIPNDPSDNPVYDYRIFSLAPIDLTTPTRVDVATGDVTIFPPDDNLGINPVSCPTGNEPLCEKFAINRHDFYLASFKNGVFKAPFCPVHKVGNFFSQTLNCDDTSTGAAVVVGQGKLVPTQAGEDIMGFGAVPDANQRCPDINLVKVPTGKKWAKLWKFRTSYTPRTIQDIANPEAIGDLFCTTRDKECMAKDVTTGATGASVCWNAKAPKGPFLGPTQSAQLGSSPTSPGFGNCSTSGFTGDGNGDVSVSGALGNVGDYTDGDSDGGDPYTNRNSVKSRTCLGTVPSGPSAAEVSYNCCKDVYQGGRGNAAIMPSNYTPGGDFCNPGLIGSNNATASDPRGANPLFTPEGGLAEDIWLLGRGDRLACIEADTDINGKLKLDIFPPPRANPFVMTAKPIDTNSKSDVLYIVTPERVNFEDMQSPETNSIAKQFTPTRMIPGTTTPQVYRLESGSQNSSTPTQRLSQFPLCVLQDAKAGTNGSGGTIPISGITFQGGF